MEILDFKTKKSIMDLDLNQLYQFLKLIDVDYVNIMDFTCRVCSTGRLSGAVTETIFEEEQRYKNKPTAF
jgi:hypothetical protein